MNKGKRILTLSLLTPCVIGVSSCSGADTTNMVFKKENIVINSFDGLGVEWGTYEDPKKLTSDSWERSLRIMHRLNPEVARVMLNYDWFIDAKSYDDKKDSDISNDTWSYDFANKYMDNTVDILHYCDDNNIDVAFGCWNVPGSK